MTYQALSLRSFQLTKEVADIRTVNGDTIPLVVYEFASADSSVRLHVKEWEGVYGYGDVIYVEWSQPQRKRPALRCFTA